MPSAPRPLATDQAPDDATTVAAARPIAIDATFFRVTGTPEEIAMDFALKGDEAADWDQPLTARPRIVQGVFTARRLLHALQAAIGRYEATCGAFEVSVEKQLTGPSDQARRLRARSR